MKHLLKLLDCSTEEIIGLLDLADQLKYEKKHNISHRHLEGKSLGMIFQKSSTRTRVSFETGMYQLGGQALFLSNRDLQIGRGEPVQDTARVLSRYLDGIMIRTYEQKEVEMKAAENADVVITDTWASMGQEAEKEVRMKAFQGYQVNDELLAAAKPGCMVQHCLPAYREQEITTKVFEEHANEIFEEAENRLHAQKAVMVTLMGSKED